MTIREISTFILSFLSVSGAAAAEPSKQIQVRHDSNIAAVTAAFEISPSGFSNWGDPGFVRPEAEQVVAYFSPHRQHEAVRLLTEMVGNGFWLDRLLNFALHAPDFSQPARPGEWPEELALAAGSGDASAGRNALDQLHSALADFYRDTDFPAYLEQRSGDRECAIGEVVSGLPAEGFVAAMEDWYGETRSVYEIVIAPSVYATMGFGVQYGDPAMPRVANIAAPFVQSADLSGYGCGYGDPDAITELSRHEFGHSFVDVQAALSAYSDTQNQALHLPIAEDMQRIGYASWPVIVEEHIVRLGEIRIAEMMHERDRAAALRQRYTEELGFIYLPALEDAIAGYESDREQWPHLSDFLPILIAAMYEAHNQQD